MDILTHSVDFALHPLAWPMLANTEVSEGAVPGGMSLPKGVTPLGAGIVAVVVIIAISVISIFLGALLAQKNTATGKIFKLAASEYKILIPATFSLYLNSALFMLLPYYGGRFVEMVGSQEGVSMDALNQVTAEILVVAVASSLTSMIRGALFVLAGERIVCELRKQVFRALLRQEIAFFDVQTTGALVSRLTNDTGTLQNAASSNISIFLRSSASLLLSVIVMLVTSWKLTLAMLVTVPVVSILAVFMSQISQRVSKKYQDETAEVGNLASETFGNLRTVRAFSSGEKLMDKKYCAASDLVYRYGRQRSMIYGAWSGVVGMLFFVAFTIVLRYGATLVHEGEMTSGQLISFVLYTVSLSGSVAMLGSIMPSFASAIGATVKIFEIIDREPAQVEGQVDPAECRGKVEFQGVSFAYVTRPDQQVLKKVSFTAEPNQVVALVGQSGSGKSSCVSLLQRLYDCQEGTVKIDDVDVKQLKYSYLRSHIAVVSQEPILFAISARENIAFGVEEINENKLMEAAKLANCHGFISDFTEGYNTLVGERGIQLSGGQKQRVAIARAIMANPSILLLDEATSALDAESEGIVQQALNQLMEQRSGRTFIVVAHRLSTVKDADRIVVLSSGECVETGTHEELLAKGQVYKDLVQRQLERT
mmetsp:Transcript_19990/g.46927  ORF Transcript_19990/g.46927 Transcript_19990/m.46927 type:complete len:651 (-) Transcript_19990:208-2160(-)